jgi:hypothetical protein
MKTLLKHWGFVALAMAVLLGVGAVRQWKSRIKADAIATEVLRVSRDSTQAALHALAKAAPILAAAKLRSDSIAERGDSVVSHYERMAARARGLSGATPDTALPDTSMTLVPKAFLAAVEEAFAAADSVASEYRSFREAALAERAAADHRFAASQRVTQLQDVQIQQLETLVKAAKPGKLEQAVKAAVLIGTGAGLGKLLDDLMNESR